MSTSTIHELAETGSISELRDYLLQHPDQIDTLNDQCLTPIFCAASAGKSENVELLVQLGSQALDRLCSRMTRITPHNGNPFIQVEPAQTPLHIAVQNGYLSTVQTIIRLSDRSLHILNGAGRTPLQMAVQYNRTKIMKFLFPLISLEESIQRADRRGNTLFHIVLETEPEPSEKTFFTLLQLGVPLRNARNQNQSTVLDQAIYANKLEMVAAIYCHDPKNFLQEDPNLTMEPYMPPMHAAATASREMVEMLYRFGYLDLDTIDNNGISPLGYALEKCKFAQRDGDLFDEEVFDDENVRTLRALGANAELELEKIRSKPPYPGIEEHIAALTTPLSKDFIAEVRFNIIFCQPLTEQLLEALDD